jgi:hypothetical protein
MDTIQLILPIIFFVLTLIIILVLRAEDSKSRSIGNVKQQIANFRAETQATISRIQATTNDAKDLLDHKIAEAKEAEDTIQNSLQRIRERGNDLMKLEDVCSNYKVALENLKLQTEQAEARISAVQKQVEQAEVIQSIVDRFKEESERTERRFAELVDDYNKLVEENRQRLLKIGDEQAERNSEMLVAFGQSLEAAKAEFATYMDGEHAKVHEEKAGYEQSVEAAVEDFETRKNALASDMAKRLGELNTRHGEILAELAAEKDKLAKANDEYETEYANCLDSLEDQVQVFNESVENGKENLSTTYQNLLDELNGQKAGVDSLIEAKLAEAEAKAEEHREYLEEGRSALETCYKDCEAGLEEAIGRMKQTGDDFSAAVDSLRTQADADFEAKKEDLSRNAEEVDEKVANSQKLLEELVEKLDGNLDNKIEAAKADYEACEERLNSAVSLMNANADEALKKYGDEVKVALSAAFQDELDKVDDNFNLQKKQITDMLETMLSRQSDMRELSVRLGQGVDNTIRSAIEKLQNLQGKIDSSMVVLKTTQEEVSKTKDKLFDYKREAVEISSKLKSRVNKPADFDDYEDEEDETEEKEEEVQEELPSIENPSSGLTEIGPIEDITDFSMDFEKAERKRIDDLKDDYGDFSDEDEENLLDDEDR